MSDLGPAPRSGETIDGAAQTDRAATLNRRAWDSFRRQRDAGLVGGRQDVVTPLVKGHSYLGAILRELAGDVRGKRLLDLGGGDGAERRDASDRWNPAGEDLTTLSWMYPLGRVVTAVAQAGLGVSHLVELPDHADAYGIAGGPGTFIVRAVKASAT